MKRNALYIILLYTREETHTFQLPLLTYMKNCKRERDANERRKKIERAYGNDDMMNDE